MKLVQSLIVALIVGSVAVAGASATTQVSWQDLVPAIEPYDDPFSNLSVEQIEDLRNILRFRQAPDAFRSDVENAARAEQASARLTAANLDIDYLFRQREIIIERRMAAASSVNEALLGKPVRLPGYVLPLEMNGRKVVEFLLVPYVGACVHTPPPDPNQLVLVNYPAGFEVDGLFTPVWVTGTLLGQSSTRAVGFSDGRADITVSYALDPVSVEKY